MIKRVLRPDLRRVDKDAHGVARLEDHPIRALFDAGVRVTLASDDALVFGAGVSDEFLALHRAGVFTAAELETIRGWGMNN